MDGYPEVEAGAANFSDLHTEFYPRTAGNLATGTNISGNGAPRRGDIARLLTRGARSYGTPRGR